MPRLIDGGEVASDSEAWRHECEARSILMIKPLQERRQWLNDIERLRGVKEADRLRATISALWAARAVASTR